MTDGNAGIWPSTLSFPGFHAAVTPDRPAVLVNGENITFRQFHDDVTRMRDALSDLGVTAGETVALEQPNAYLHWLMILACEALGAVSYSYPADALDEEADALGSVDLVLHAPSAPPRTAPRSVAVDQAWIAAVMARPQGGPLEPDLYDGARVLRMKRGSGTTGQPKRMVHNAAMQAYRLRLHQFRMGFNRNSRLLIGNSFHVDNLHVIATACLRAGGACVTDTRAGTADNIRT